MLFDRHLSAPTSTQRHKYRIAICGLKKLASAGGIETAARISCRLLAENGHQISLFTQALQPVEQFTQQYREVQIKARMRGKYSGYFSYMANVTMLLIRKRSSFDVVHLHSPCVHGMWALILKAFGLRIVLHAHGRERRASKWPPPFKVFMIFSELVAARCADGIICVCAEDQVEFRKMAWKRQVPITIIPNGIERPQRSMPPPDSQDQLGPNHWHRPYILFAGRLVPQKRVHDLLKAFAQTELKVDLVIAGKPSNSEDYRDSLAELARDDNRVTFVGAVGRDELKSHFRESLCAVFPSDHEGCPNALLEALSTETPCLLSDIRAHSDILGNSSGIYPVGDIAALRDLLRKVGENGAFRERLRGESRRVIKEWPTWETVSKALDLFYHVLSGDALNHE